ncbi:MAG TPA: serine/threonine-protein kinase, partial [Burkholderiaceae bacterium]
MSTPTSSSIPPQSPSSAVPANVVIEHDALPIGTRFGEFEVLRVVGVGGFGIVYLAQDHSLERQVALKEYMPAALAARSDGSHITVRSAAFAETYAIGLRSFVNEARLLARFDHPSLVKVYRFWEDNGTAYMVMPFLRGMTLRDARRGMDRAPDEAWIRGVIDPLLGALELLHREGVFHRDIAPDNILLPPSGPPILLDFGAARHVISDRTQSLTAILKPSYAPIEQYAEMSSMRQGPWTDIYALGAVMHYLLFGMPPAPATARAVQPDAEPVAQRQVPGISPNMLAAVGWTLGVRPLERPQSIAVLRDALNGVVAIPEPR